MTNGFTVEFGNVEKGIVYAIKRHSKTYVKNRARGENLGHPKIWGDGRSITFPYWPREHVDRALEYAKGQLGPKAPRLDPEIREATVSDFRQREAPEDADEDEDSETAEGEPVGPTGTVHWQRQFERLEREKAEGFEAYEVQIRQLQASHEEQLRREQAKSKGLEHQIHTLRTDRDRVQREREEADKGRRALEEQNDVLVKSLSSLADDPSRAAIQVVARAASWIRRLESSIKEPGDLKESSHIGEYLRIAKLDLLDFVNSRLEREGRHVGSLAELEGLSDALPWTASEYHLKHVGGYTAAKRESDFLKKVENGEIDLPESFRTLLSEAGDPSGRLKTIQEYESAQASHQGRIAAGELAKQAKQVHEYATGIKSGLEGRREKDPIPIAVVYRGDGSENAIHVQVPVGPDAGPVSAFVQRAIEEAARDAGFQIERQNGPGKEPALSLVPVADTKDRALLLKMQGEFRESLSKLLAGSPLKEASVSFRIIDLRDFMV